MPPKRPTPHRPLALSICQPTLFDYLKMCLNNNSATLSARYLNAQLSAMWQNAAECVGHEGKMTTVDLRSTEYDQHKYTRSLAQFHFAGTRSPRGSLLKENLFFDGTFGEPRLEFICNHEVALYLKLQKGHFNKVYPTKATVNGYKCNTCVFFVSRLEVFKSLTSD